jgi:predicted DNA-binding transcriptional regulator AlpA
MQAKITATQPAQPGYRHFLRANQLYSTKDQDGILPVSPAKLWRMVQAETFPKPMSLGGTTAWRAADVESWLIKTFGTDLQGQILNPDATGLPKTPRSQITVRGGKGRAKKSATAGGL